MNFNHKKAITKPAYYHPSEKTLQEQRGFCLNKLQKKILLLWIFYRMDFFFLVYKALNGGGPQ